MHRQIDKWTNRDGERKVYLEFLKKLNLRFGKLALLFCVSSEWTLYLLLPKIGIERQRQIRNGNLPDFPNDFLDLRIHMDENFHEEMKKINF